MGFSQCRLAPPLSVSRPWLFASLAKLSSGGVGSSGVEIRRSGTFTIDDLASLIQREAISEMTAGERLASQFRRLKASAIWDIPRFRITRMFPWSLHYS